MKRSRFSEEQIIGLLQRNESGVTASQLCREVGISESTFYQWKSKFGGMNVSEAKRLRQLEAENAQLKRIVADQAVDIVALKDVLSKNGNARSPESSRASSAGRTRSFGAAGMFIIGYCRLQFALPEPSR